MLVSANRYSTERFPLLIRINGLESKVLRTTKWADLNRGNLFYNLCLSAIPRKWHPLQIKCHLALPADHLPLFFPGQVFLPRCWKEIHCRA
jgi:hypothetical protein